MDTKCPTRWPTNCPTKQQLWIPAVGVKEAPETYVYTTTTEKYSPSAEEDTTETYEDATKTQWRTSRSRCNASNSIWFTTTKTNQCPAAKFDGSKRKGTAEAQKLWWKTTHRKNKWHKASTSSVEPSHRIALVWSSV